MKIELKEDAVWIDGVRYVKEEQAEDLPAKRWGRAEEGDTYFVIDSEGAIIERHEISSVYGNTVFNNANYFRFKKDAIEIEQYQRLQRLLHRYSMMHDGDKIDWDNRNQAKYFIVYDYKTGEYTIKHVTREAYQGVIYFYSYTTALNAISIYLKN